MEDAQNDRKDNGFHGEAVGTRAIETEQPIFVLIAHLPRARSECYMMGYTHNLERDTQCLLRRIGPGRLVKARAD